MSSSTTSFINTLTVFKRFEDITNFDQYESIPDDWVVLISDVENSTEAISRGMYKPVNFCGVALLALFKNYKGDTEFPFVFGGDGATVCLPKNDFNDLKPSFIRLKKMAKNEFDLDLRVGYVPQKIIRENGYKIKVALYEVSEHYHQSCFTGGGLAYADKLIKQNTNRQLEISENQKSHANTYDGLECRWDHMPARNGTILSLIVHAKPNGNKTAQLIYEEVIDKMRTIYDNFTLGRPLEKSMLKLTYQPQKLSVETKARSHSKGFLGKTFYMLKLWFQNLLGMLFINFEMETGGIIWKNYKPDLVQNSDYRKFDDTLRMVLNSSEKQSRELRGYLSQKKENDELYFGIHHSSHALITCLITHRNGKHIHFVDGSNGGYAKAASKMKDQMAP